MNKKVFPLEMRMKNLTTALSSARLIRSVQTLGLIAIGVAVGVWFSAGERSAVLEAQSPLAAAPIRIDEPANRAIILGEPIFNPAEAINIAVYEATNRGVVNISTKAVRSTSLFRESSVEGSGSGSVIDLQGHILTNYHVIEAAQEINVVLSTGDSYPAEKIGEDADNDIAVLRISAPVENLHPIPLGDSSTLKVGQHIIAIGNPFGLERTMSDGIISSLNRQITSKTRRLIKSIIQIDAALNQGNSGGPLLNSAGEIIGMNTAIATSTGDNAGIGFAIPVNTIGRVVPQLIANGRVVRPTIGITRVFEAEDGLLIVSVTPSGPADKAGLQGFKVIRRRVRRGLFEFDTEQIDQKSADLIVGINGAKVKSADDLLSTIESKRAGDKVTLRVVRDGEPRDVVVTLGSDE